MRGPAQSTDIGERGPLLLNLFEFDLRLFPSSKSIDWLSLEEKDRAQSFGPDDARRRFISSRAWLRSILSNVLARDPASIAFKLNAWGKPEISGGPEFNLSRSGDSAVLVVGGAAPLGIDVEVGGTLGENEIELVLAADELSAARAATFNDDQRLRLWVRKEAVLKALGRGMSFDPRLVSIGFGKPDFETPRTVKIFDAGKKLEFALLDVNLGAGKFGAVARSGSTSFSCVAVSVAAD